MANLAIRVDDLSKCYHLYDRPRDRIKQIFVPPLRRLVGQPSGQIYREFWALKDVSFEIEKGETVGIIGRNGSGKSTLLQLICGTLTPTRGSVQIDGRIAALLELGAGFSPEFTGRENIRMGCMVLGLTKAETEAKFDAIAAFADIGDHLDQPVKTYSSGMYVRLAFSVNLVSEPDIMIVDEALAVGDMSFQAKCMTALMRLRERGATVLFVSHDIGVVKSLCSRCVYLEHGIVKEIGSAGSVAEHYVKGMREKMNSESVSALSSAGARRKPTVSFAEQRPGLAKEFKTSIEFEKQAAYGRYGDGGAKITFAELLDEDLHPIREVRFNQSVLVRVYFETSIEGDISCNYYVLDDKKNLILGAGLQVVDHPLLQVKTGDRYVVTYKTRLPLQEGNYSIQLQITTPVVLDHTARFLEVIDDALVFNMSRREGARIWTKMYVSNEVEVESC